MYNQHDTIPEKIYYFFFSLRNLAKLKMSKKNIREKTQWKSGAGGSGFVFALRNYGDGLMETNKLCHNKRATIMKTPANIFVITFFRCFNERQMRD